MYWERCWHRPHHFRCWHRPTIRAAAAAVSGIGGSPDAQEGPQDPAAATEADPKQLSPTQPHCNSAIASVLRVTSDTVITTAQIGSRRREFLALVGGGSLARPLVAGAQHLERTRRISILSPGRSELPDPTFNMLNAFLQGLRELGYTEGENLTIERRYANGSSDQLR